MALDVTKTHVLHQWKHGRPMIACCFDPHGRYLFSSSEDYTLQRWNVETGEKIAWEAHDSWVRDIVFLPDGETAISAGCDDRIIFWPTAAEKPEPKVEVVAHKGWIRSLDVNVDGSLIASGGNDRAVKLWSPNGKLVREMAGHERDVYSVFFHPDGQFLLSGDLDGKVHQWEIDTGKLVRTFEAKDLHTYNGGQQVHYGGIRDITLSPDKKTLALTGLHKATNPLGAVNEPLNVLFDWDSGKEIRKQPADGVRGIGWQIEYLSDGTEIVASGGSGGGYLLFFKPEEEKPFHKLKLKDTARDMSLHPDGLHVATAHYDAHIRVYRMTEKAA
ncbi:MAG: WD40 repeat domain-containing protein [Planctomycetota bacterium]|jgi:WD40 repeat protein